MIDINISKRLTEDEKEVFGIIKNVIKTYSPHTTAYAVGGWTRDKLLGIESDDIDIMLDDCSGEYFAKLVTQYLKLRDPRVIKENPEKSKHITTAKAFIPLSSGTRQEIDFAQARKDVYEEGSRIPTGLEDATPQEDAFRRDLTINSIFYNINTGTVEDFTGKGLEDLMAMHIQTPQDPYQTFTEDPLRIFRVIRFAAKYNGSIDPDTMTAIKDPKMWERIKIISRDRIGQEFMKMLKNPNPHIAISLLKETGLLDNMIGVALENTEFHNKLFEFDMEQNNSWHDLSVWGHTYQTILNTVEQFADDPPEKRAIAILAALFHDIGKLYGGIHGESKSHPGKTSYHGHEDISAIIAPYVMRYLRLTGQTLLEVKKLVGAHMRPHRFTEEGVEVNPKTMRKFIRKMTEQGIDWLDVVKLALSDANAKGIESNPEVVAKYENLKSQLQAVYVQMNAAPVKEEALVNGNEIMLMYPGKKSGAWVGEIKEFVKDLQDENPAITKEEAVDRILQAFPPEEPPNPPNPDGLSTEAANKKSSYPSAFLLSQKVQDIENAMSQDFDYMAFKIMEGLTEQYGNDERVSHIVSKTVFNAVAKDKNKNQHNNLIEYVFRKASREFFDDIICTYALGILLTIKTDTEEVAIEKLANKMLKMNPALLKEVISKLPEEIAHESIKKNINRKLS